MLLSLRRAGIAFEVYDLNAADTVVANFDQRWQALDYMRKYERAA